MTRQEGYKNNKTRITEGLARLEKEIESFEGEKYRQSEELKVHLRAAEQLQMRCKDIERRLRDAKGGSVGGVEGRIGAIVGPKAKDAYVQAYELYKMTAC